MLGLRDYLIAAYNYVIRDYRQGGTGLFSEVPSDGLKDSLYKPDGLQLLFCDFYTSGNTDSSKKIALPCFSS